MPPPHIEKPLSRLKKSFTKEALGKLGKNVKEGLGEMLKATVESGKMMFEWFKGLFQDVKEKGLKESLMGPLIGFLTQTETIADRLKKKEKKEVKKEEEKAEKPVITKETLKEEVEKKRQPEIKPPEPFDQTKVKSEFYREDDKGITLCSGTARSNLKKLSGKPDHLFKSIRKNPHTYGDIQAVLEEAKKGKFDIKDIIPTGNADDIQQFYSATRPDIIRMGGASKMIQSLNLSGVTVCDVVTYGSTKFDHRAAGFKGVNGNWYVLDPYKGALSVNPIPLEDYIIKYKTDVAFLVPIKTSGPNPNIEKPDTPSNRVVNTALGSLSTSAKGMSCWEWANQMYEKAGARRQTIYPRQKDNQFAKPNLVKKIKPGTHLYIHNQNELDEHGNHSVIFLRWANKNQMKAIVASSWKSAEKPRLKVVSLDPAEYDEKDKKKSSSPVTYIAEPA